MIHITRPGELKEFAEEHGLRPDWHEPDEQDIKAFCYGNHLDNASGPYLHEADPDEGEYVVMLLNDHGDPLALVNVADLLAWAATGDEGLGR